MLRFLLTVVALVSVHGAALAQGWVGQTFEPLSEQLIGKSVYSAYDRDAAPIGDIVDLTVSSDGTVNGLIVDTRVGGESNQILVDIGQTFIAPNAVDNQVWAGIGVDDAAKVGAFVEDEDNRLWTTIKDVLSVTEERTQLIVEAGGNKVASDIANLFASMRATYGERAFPTRPYTVQAGDTYCAILEKQLSIPTSGGCDVQSRLGDMLNSAGISALKEKAVIQIPDIQVTSRLADVWTGKQFEPQTIYEVGVSLDGLIARGTVDDLLPSLGSSDITAYTVDSGAGVDKALQSWIPVPREPEACTAAPASSAEESSFYYLFPWLEASNWTPSEQIMQCAFHCNEAGGPGSACADLILVDSLPNQTADLGKFGVLGADGVTSLPAEAHPQSMCTAESLDVDRDHGAHLAALLASKADGRGYVGMAPGLDLFSFEWTRRTRNGPLQNLVDAQREIFGETGPQIYLFASRFPGPGSQNRFSYPLGDIAHEELTSDRAIEGPAIVQRVRDSNRKAMWIVAAMQGGGDIGSAREIRDRLPYAPANLGKRLSNVIVVTACSTCGDGDAEIMADTFWSQDHVHVAAPGNMIVAPVGENRLAYASGTSQATALVAGLVGAMTNCYRDHFQESGGDGALETHLIKQRLLYTSRPVFRGDDLKKLEAGVVDPVAALLDPEENWIKWRGERDYAKLDFAHWCSPKITTADNSEEEKSFTSKNVLRMVRMKFPGGIQGDESPWVFYSYLDEDSVIRFDPRVFVGDGDETPIFATTNGDKVSPSDFEDLILEETISTFKPC